nr:MAK10-like protein [Tanacetum cinerariifolium]
MGDENPICTLRDYSKPSHEGYRNTIKLTIGNNVVPLRSDTIQLVQNGCSFHGLRSEDPNQHFKDFLKLVDSLDLNGENRKRTRLRSRGGTEGETKEEEEDNREHFDTFPTMKELRNHDKGIIILSKLLSLKYLSQSSIIEQNKNPLSPKCVHFVSLIAILNKQNEAEEEGSVELNKTNYTNRKNANETDEKVESEKEVEEELKEKPKKKRRIIENTSIPFPL